MIDRVKTRLIELEKGPQPTVTIHTACGRSELTGADIAKPIAVPLIGGMVTSTIHVLLVTPIIFQFVKKRDLRLGRLKPSGLRAES